MNRIMGNMLWPGLWLADPFIAWYVVLVGLIVEYFFIRKATTLNWKVSFFADIASNAASAIVGALLIPIIGLVWEILMGGRMTTDIVKPGTYNALSWSSVGLLAAVLNTFIETGVLFAFFKQQRTRKLVYWMFLANCASLAVCFIIYLIIDTLK